MDEGPIRIEVQTSRGPLRGTLPVPPHPMRLAELAYGFLELSSKAVEVESRASVQSGRAISCQKGCGACCRQLVPLSPAEAWLLADLVAAMPSTRQGEVRTAFASAVQRISESPLAAAFEQGVDAPRSLAMGVAFFQLGIACPFLVDESCSIHPQRPSICREYLVTSPAEHCVTLGRAPITRVPIRTHLSAALVNVSARMLERRAEVVPLPLALVWAEQNREEGQRRFDARTMMTALAEELTKTTT